MNSGACNGGIAKGCEEAVFDLLILQYTRAPLLSVSSQHIVTHTHTLLFCSILPSPSSQVALQVQSVVSQLCPNPYSEPLMSIPEVQLDLCFNWKCEGAHTMHWLYPVVPVGQVQPATKEYLTGEGVFVTVYVFKTQAVVCLVH